MNKEIPSTQKALQYQEYGDPAEVLSLIELPVPEPGPGEVLIEMQASPIHPSDLGLIMGSYGRPRIPPAIAGREGVGTVVKCGVGVDVKVMGRPVALPEDGGAWQEYQIIRVEDLILFPALVPFEQLALSVLNPMTAWRLLNDFEYLNTGDVIIQNAGNSAVGQSVIQFAKKMGVKCISLVRNLEYVELLKELGSTAVWLDDDEVPERTKVFTEGKGCKLALNSVGGRSALRLTRSLCSGGVHVTFGAMDGSAVRFPTRNLIFDDVRMVGFWLDRWRRKQSPAGLRNALEQVHQPLAMTDLKHSIDQIFNLSEFKDAFARNAQPRVGKVLLARDKEFLQTLSQISR
jgi:NADPH:quinone reductase-like Zn-dependent oxidoreductase